MSKNKSKLLTHSFTHGIAHTTVSGGVLAGVSHLCCTAAPGMQIGKASLMTLSNNTVFGVGGQALLINGALFGRNNI